MSDDFLKMYDAAMAHKADKELRASLARRREDGRQRRERERRTIRRNAIIFALLLAVMGTIVVMRIYSLEAEVNATAPAENAEPKSKAAENVPAPAAEANAENLPAGSAMAELTMLDAQPSDTDQLLAAGYYSLAVPMPYEYQGYMRIYCAKYGCPYPLALATAERESTFSMDAVGVLGEVGIMQLNPGPDGAYHAELERATGLDPTTPEGNIAGGCYMLGTYMQKYGDQAKAAMAYNMGEGGAKKAWAAGTTSTEYSRAILEGVEKWECIVNAWNGV